MKDNSDIQSEFKNLALEWGMAFVSGDYRTANRRNNALTKLARNFKNNVAAAEAILKPLLDHPEPAIRLMASVHALDQGIAIEQAETVLRRLSESQDIRLIPIMAQVNLSKWYEKKALTKRAS